MIDPDRIRSDFPLFDGGSFSSTIYLDNAASTQKPRQVIEAIAEFYSSSYANVHRSPHRIGMEATERFEGARQKIAAFIGAPDSSELVFTRGTTEAINLIAGILTQQYLKPGDVILCTPSEHHSNLIPWQMAAARSGAALEFINLHDGGRFDPEEIAGNWNPATKVFAFQHASNVTGAVHPVQALTGIARNRGALTVVDGAQAVPHLPVDIGELGCDFYALSAHKMCGPCGIGGLWGRRELLERFQPIFGGGEMIVKVTLTSAQYNAVPFKFEPGTPNIAGVVGWGAAVDYLTRLGMDHIENYITELTESAVGILSDVEGVTVHGPRSGRTGAVSFTVDGIHPHDVASILDTDDIAVRAGHHCAEPLTNWLGVAATTRASFYIYNTRDEAVRLAESIAKAQKVMSHVA